jgi:predicted GTPase
VLVVDGQYGLHPSDEEVLTWLRHNHPSKPVVLAVNKCESQTKGATQVSMHQAAAQRTGGMHQAAAQRRGGGMHQAASRGGMHQAASRGGGGGGCGNARGYQ